MKRFLAIIDMDVSPLLVSVCSLLDSSALGLASKLLFSAVVSKETIAFLAGLLVAAGLSLGVEKLLRLLLSTRQVGV